MTGIGGVLLASEITAGGTKPLSLLTKLLAPDCCVRLAKVCSRFANDVGVKIGVNPVDDTAVVKGIPLV